MRPNYVTDDESDPNDDCQMVGAGTTHAGALYWALARLRQARPLGMHV